MRRRPQIVVTSFAITLLGPSCALEETDLDACTYRVRDINSEQCIETISAAVSYARRSDGAVPPVRSET